MSLANRCTAHFDYATRYRGKSYAAIDAVAIVGVDDCSVEADVHGSRGNQYEVSIDWSDEENGRLRTSCTCPHFSGGTLCKHIWATLLTVDRQQYGPLLNGPALSIELMESDDTIWIDEETDSATEETESTGLLDHTMRMLHLESEPTIARRRSGPGNGSGPPAQQPDWTAPFRELRRPAFRETPLNSLEELNRRPSRVWYIVDVSATIAKSALTIDLFYQLQKKNGDFGKAKRLRLKRDNPESIPVSADRELLAQLLACAPEETDRYEYGYSHSYRNKRTMLTSLQLPASMYAILLPRLAATGRFLWMLDTSQPIEEGHEIAWSDSNPLRFRIKIDADDDTQQWTLRGEFLGDDNSVLTSEIVCIAADGLLLTKTHLCRVDTSAHRSWIQWAMRHGSISVPYEHRDAFLKMIWSAPSLPPAVWPDNLVLDHVIEPPQPRLRVRDETGSFQRDLLRAEVAFAYGDVEIASSNTVSGFPERENANGPITRVRVRDIEHERAAIRELKSVTTVHTNQYGLSQGTLSFKKRMLPELVNRLLPQGWQIEAEGKQFRSPGDFHINVESGIDWFDLDASIDFGGVTAQLPDLLSAVRRGDKYVQLDDGSCGILPEHWLEKYTGLAELGETTDGKVRFKRSQALLLDTLLAEQKNLRVDHTFARFRQRLRSFDGVTPKNAPRTFHGTLREYQRDGLGWFKFLNDLEIGGCLADDMGLGKTVQILALLEARRTQRLRKDETRIPSLAVVPKSLIFNWIDEAQRFTPRLRVVNYTGIARKQAAEQLDDAHLILTTYGTLRRDILELKERRFDMVILDEAQAIKNANSQAAKACLLLQANRRLALTGTPIENHLGELWSLFEFLNPGMLGHSRAFAAVCKNARNDDGAALRDLSRAIAPFILRRTKEQVLTELPEKTEQTLYCELAPKQRKEYNALRDFYRAKLSKVIDQKGLRQSKIHVLEALLRLRQAACHPGLVDRQKAKESSAKLDTLFEQLEEITGEGHRALVFSQFTSLLAIVRQRMDKLSMRYEYLDGKTRNRKEVVDRFQQRDGCEVFLISLKAGGQGLNLTEADYVFILDPWWNPAVEMQAIDRVHRIGQTKPVFAYRIIARDTVEEKVLELQKGKRELADAIITANDSLIRKLTADDLQRILS